METNTTSRPFDATKARAIDYFYHSTIGSGLYVAIFVPITLGLCLGGAFFGLYKGLAAGILLSALWVTLKQLRIRKNIKRAKYIYEHGEKANMTFVSRENNYNIKLNGAPQQVITVQLNGRTQTIKTFDYKVIRVYTIPQQTVYTHPDYPKTHVPAGIFQLEAQKPGRTLRFALILALSLVFVFAITLFLQRTTTHSYTPPPPSSRTAPAPSRGYP